MQTGTEAHDEGRAVDTGQSRTRSKDADSPDDQGVGALFWWRLIESATPHVTLAQVALNVAFPTLFLPAPVGRVVAFRRCLERSTSSVPNKIGGRWLAEVPPAVAARPLIGYLMKWNPTRAIERPFEVMFDCALDRSQDAELKKDGQVLDIRRRQKGVSSKMEERVRQLFLHERTHATAPEINDCLSDTFTEVMGLKLRPGLFLLPGQSGINLARATVEVVRAVGASKAGMFVLDAFRDDLKSIAGDVAENLNIEVEDLHAEIIEVLQTCGGKPAGTGALRTRWEKLGTVILRVRAFGRILGKVEQELQAKVAELRSLLEEEAERRGVSLERRATANQVKSLHDVLQMVCTAATNRDRDRLAAASGELRKGQPAARAGLIAHLYSRLRSLTIAAVQVDEEILYEALAQAAEQVMQAAQRGRETPVAS